jgi:hypothetical protein
MKKQNEKLALKKNMVKDIKVRSGVQAGAIPTGAGCHPHSGLSMCVRCPQ